ncbi:hypothetical protein NLI96_g10593 [Meripilus lineatus]|uniref:Uncharacterized protein n=1 Tax=Meripilus lineatus TaxID=2056292 RepID=A0AAD5Y962_9APHY|nr:hypothetical protein NLI96_g10593 [Physisporinus lineatus]
MPSRPSRPSLPASSTDFALPPSSSSASIHASSSSNAPFPSPSEEINPLLLRFRRPSLLGPRSNSEGRLHSPLATSFTLPLSRRYSTSIPSEQGEESESDKDKMWTDSPPSVDSGTNTPAISDPSSVSASLSNNSTLSVDSDGNMKVSTRPRSPSTPPPKTHTKGSGDPGSSQDVLPSTAKMRRLSHPIRMPRILTLLAEEAHPAEDEVKSEAQFQRLVASCSDLPLQPRTPRAASDRGRYPEEVPNDDPTRENTPSDDDDDEGETAPFAFGGSEPISITKPVTPAHSVNGDEFLFSESPGGAAMDIDLPSSVYGSPNMNSWRYTPPPTSSAVRSNKRKFEDRYDPYPTANKRRAVSPSLSYLRENQPSLFNPRTPNSSRVPMPLPIAIPNGLNSGASSPVFPSSGSMLTNSRPLSYGSASALSSPTLRAQIGLASPILRPMIRARRGDGEFKEVDGAGDAVNSLTLE